MADALDRPAAGLTVAGRKRLELARALAIEPRLLLLDEVLAGLNPSEIRDMVPVIRAIRDRGITIVMIEHVMQAVMSLAEHVFVLSEGRIIAQGSPQAIAGDPRVVEAYLGHGAASRMARSCPWLSRCWRSAACTPATARPRSCAASTSTVNAGRDRRGAGLERRRKVDPQPHHFGRDCGPGAAPSASTSAAIEREHAAGDRRAGPDPRAGRPPHLSRT